MPYDVAKDRLTKGGTAVDYIKSSYIGSAFRSPPKIAVIHFTAGGTARSSAEWFRNPGNRGQSSAHFVIERDGAVIQCVPLDRVAHHAGKSTWRGLSGLNQHSFGIELANWGYLKRAGDGWACSTGSRINDPVLAVHKNGNPDGMRRMIGWENYTEAQFKAAVAVVGALVDRLGVTEIVGHDDIAPTRKWDPGPAFNMARFKAAVFGDRSEDGDVRMKVIAANGLNLRAGAGIEFSIIEQLPQGTLLEPLATRGLWTEASVLDGAGEPRLTGWVHSRYIADA